MAQKNNSYSKGVGDYNANSGNEFGAHNYVHINFGAGGSIVAVVFVCLLFCAALGWLVHTQSMLVGGAVILLFVLAVAAGIVLLAVGTTCVVLLFISRTQARISYDHAQPLRNRVLAITPTAMALHDPRQERTWVENAQQVSIQHHHAAPAYQISEVAESRVAGEDIPPMTDLLR